MLKYMIGIDAGGTHSTAIAYDENGKELGRAESAQVKSTMTTNSVSRILLKQLMNCVTKLMAIVLKF